MNICKRKNFYNDRNSIIILIQFLNLYLVQSPILFYEDYLVFTKWTIFLNLVPRFYFFESFFDDCYLPCVFSFSTHDQRLQKKESSQLRKEYYHNVFIFIVFFFDNNLKFVFTFVKECFSYFNLVYFTFNSIV